MKKKRVCCSFFRCLQYYVLLFLFPIGQFWNIPVTVRNFTGQPRPGVSTRNFYTITVNHPRDPPRTFVGRLYEMTWEFRPTHCLYVGNRQGGPISEVLDPNDSVIRGSYQDYIVNGLFESSFDYSVFNSTRCPWKSDSQDSFYTNLLVFLFSYLLFACVLSSRWTLWFFVTPLMLPCWLGPMFMSHVMWTDDSCVLLAIILLKLFLMLTIVFYQSTMCTSSP